MLVPVMEAADEDTEDDEDARFRADALQGLSDAIVQAAHSSPLDLGLVPQGSQAAAQAAAGCSRLSAAAPSPSAASLGQIPSLAQDARAWEGRGGPARGPARALRAAVAARRAQAAPEARARCLRTLLPGLLPADSEVRRPSSLLLAGLEQIQDDKPCLDIPSLSQAETECSGDEGEHRGREAASCSEVESSDNSPSDDAWGT